MKTQIEILRQAVATMQRARKAGMRDFYEHAKLHKSEVKTALYHEIKPISDGMAVVNGVLVLTWENLQYFPAKVRYFIPVSSKW